MGAGGSKPQVSPEEYDRIQRKCKPLLVAYQRCQKANPGDPKACSNLDTSLVTCYAKQLVTDAAQEHERCFMSLMNTGGYKGKHNCDAYVEAMRKGLKQHKLYPPPDA
jgi:hypothetical protein